MIPSLKRARCWFLVLADLLLCPLVYPAAWLLKPTRRAWVVEIGSGQSALLAMPHGPAERLKAVAPYLTPDCEPGSFYLRRKAPGGG